MMTVSSIVFLWFQQLEFNFRSFDQFFPGNCPYSFIIDIIILFYLFDQFRVFNQVLTVPHDPHNQTRVWSVPPPFPGTAQPGYSPRNGLL